MIFRFLTLFIFASAASFAQPYPQDYFQAPVNIPLALSGTFGELRGNHFHAGFDIKTQGREGLSVLAAAEGQIVRIKVSAYGYGNALYVAHPNGYTTVYGHLNSFTADVAAWVKSQQYAKKSFEVDLFPPAGKFTFKQGDEIAKSGNTGGSGGPHLHFEIRDSKTEETINPAFFGLPVADKKKPIITHLYAAPVSDGASVLGKSTLSQIPLTSLGNGVYSGSFSAVGMIGLELNTYDQQDLTSNKNGVLKIEQFVSDTLNYVFEIDKFEFSNGRYINAHIDYKRYKNNSQKNHKTYVEEGNKLPAYSNLVNRGLISLKPNDKKQIKIIVSDSWGNQSEIRLTATGEEAYPWETSAETKTSWQNSQSIKIEGVKVSISAGTLYKDEEIKLSTRPACGNCLTEIYKIGENTIPAHKRFSLSIHKDQLAKTDKVVWAAVNSSGNGSGLTSTWEGDWLVAHPRDFGDYAVMEDQTAPTLNVTNFANGKIVKRGTSVSMTATDYLSGITFYEATIDGSWVLLKHDGKRNYFWHDFEDSLATGSHVLTLTFKDEVGNITTFQSVFTYQP